VLPKWPQRNQHNCRTLQNEPYCVVCGMTKSLPDLERVRRLDDEFGLFAELDTAAVCGELARDPLHGPLAGKVIGLKANIACAGAPWSAGLAHRADINALTDAHVTARLRAAGARVLPGLNMDAAALGGTTENPHFGATRNPLATAFSAGGSSGGSGAAVAAGLVDVAIGTDTLGSIRIPAAYCGLYGLKPTFGLIGRSGIVPLAPSLDCAGPLCASSRHLWPVVRSLAGFDADDPDSILAPQGWDGSEPTPSMTGLRIGVPEQMNEITCEPEIRAGFDRTVAAVKRLGATVSGVAMPGWRPAALRKAAFLMTECEGAVVYAQDLEAGDRLPRAVQSLLGYGRDVTAGKLVAALGEARTARQQLARTFAEVDLVLTPTTPQRATRLNSAAPANQADFTALANVAGIPALAVPVAVKGEVLPASVQLTGPSWSEGMLVCAAMALEEALAD
jgi:aspartyl-tRNA(Asn)/glutamyl-tRNA(Gln) amidotransferase subunit A